MCGTATRLPGQAVGGSLPVVKAEESVLVEPLGEEFLLFRQVRVLWTKWGAETFTNVWDQ